MPERNRNRYKDLRYHPNHTLPYIPYGTLPTLPESALFSSLWLHFPSPPQARLFSLFPFLCLFLFFCSYSYSFFHTTSIPFTSPWSHFYIQLPFSLHLHPLLNLWRTILVRLPVLSAADLQLPRCLPSFFPISNFFPRQFLSSDSLLISSFSP